MTAERYLAFVHFGGERPGHWTQRLQELSAKLDLTLIEAGSFVAITKGRSIKLRTGGLDGLIIGALFRRGERQAVTGATGAEADSILTTGGQALVDHFWGGYVALLRSSHFTAILRAPMGDLACYYRHCADGLLVASDPQLLFDAVGDRPAIDWDAIARHLIAPNLCRAETCLESVVELAGGERLTATPAAAVETLWNPWTFVSPDHRPDDKAAAAERVRETILSSVAAQASCHKRTVLLLSGGLDSSIVAAALAKSGHSFAGLTMVTHAAGGDERAFAGSVAAHCAFPLQARMREAAVVELERSAGRDLPYPNERSFSQATRAAADQLAAETGATAIAHGGGGDNIFCSLQSAAPLADLLRVHGVTRAAATLTRDIATIAQATHSAVVKQAMARLLWRSPRYRWEALTTMLSSDGLHALDSALEHPWLAAPAKALPGSAGQIGVLLAALSLVQSPSTLGTPWRSVLLAQPVVEACLSIPTWLWFERGRNRAVARHAFAPLLPASIAWRASKGAMDSFVVEIFEANRAKATAMVLDGHLARSGLIDRAAAERTLRDDGPTRGIAYGRIMQFVDVEAWLASWTGGTAS